jgi:hypothetical protein
MIARRIALIVSIALIPAAVCAFWSKGTFQIPVIGSVGPSDFEIHQDITSWALGSGFGIPGGTTNYFFSQPAIQAINAQHKVQDSDPYDSADHFDSEDFALALVKLQAERNDLQNKFLAGPLFDQPTIWAEMGRMLHMIQDFYAHSNYVVTSGAHLPDTVNFGLLTAAGPLAIPPNWGGYELPTCATNGSTLLPNLSIITTGYYPPIPAPSGSWGTKCNHGWQSTFVNGTNLTVVNIGQNCLSGTMSPADGIARDAPCFNSFADNQLFYERLELAEQETVQFVTSIIDSLIATGNYAGFCALLGLPATDSVCPPSLPQSGSFTGQYAFSGSCQTLSAPNVATQAPCSDSGTFSGTFSGGPLAPNSDNCEGGWCFTFGLSSPLFGTVPVAPLSVSAGQTVNVYGPYGPEGSPTGFETYSATAPDFSFWCTINFNTKPVPGSSGLSYTGTGTALFVLANTVPNIYPYISTSNTGGTCSMTVTYNQ